MCDVSVTHTPHFTQTHSYIHPTPQPDTPVPRDIHRQSRLGLVFTITLFSPLGPPSRSPRGWEDPRIQGPPPFRAAHHRGLGCKGVLLTIEAPRECSEGALTTHLCWGPSLSSPCSIYSGRKGGVCSTQLCLRDCPGSNQSPPPPLPN